MHSPTLRPRGLYDYRAYIANESFARSLIEALRWPDGIRCLRCTSDAIWQMADDYRCRSCRYHFSAITGTALSGSHLTLSQWIVAIGLFKVGVNGLGLQWAIGCHYRTALRTLRVLRTAVATDPLIAKLSGEVEVDEAYVGGRQKGQRGRSPKGKTIVLGFKQRGDPSSGTRGLAKTTVIPDVTRETLHGKVQEHVVDGSTVYSDGLKSYDGLTELGYQHLPFDHSVQFIQTDVIHTQGIEGHWGNTKPLMKARHRKLTHQNMPGILAETDFRSNHRLDEDFISLVLRFLVRSNAVLCPPSA